jgi:hypothetical protein
MGTSFYHNLLRPLNENDDQTVVVRGLLWLKLDLGIPSGKITTTTTRDVDQEAKSRLTIAWRAPAIRRFARIVQNLTAKASERFAGEGHPSTDLVSRC